MPHLLLEGAGLTTPPDRGPPLLPGQLLQEGGQLHGATDDAAICILSSQGGKEGIRRVVCVSSGWV